MNHDDLVVGLKWLRAGAATFAALLLVTLMMFLFVALAHLRTVTREIREGQRCIVGALLVQPEERRFRNGEEFDILCGFELGTMDRIREDLGVEGPHTPQE